MPSRSKPRVRVRSHARGQPVETLENVGPTIARRLREVGIETRSDLARVGPVQAFLDIRERHPWQTISVCYYLYSLEGALRGAHWDALAPTRKRELRRAAGLD